MNTLEELEARVERIRSGKEQLNTVAKIKNFWLEVIALRGTIPKEANLIAHVSFPAVRDNGLLEDHPELERINYELIALEAPGAPEDENEPRDAYAERLWRRLEAMILKIKV